MSKSIVLQLVKKDLLIVRKTLIICCLISVACVGIISLLFGRVPNWAFYNLGITLLVVPVGTCGMILLMRTIVQEKDKSTQLFIMSLPLTVKEFTLAKLLVNLPPFFVLWLFITGTAFYFTFGLGVFPYGTLPFIAMIFLGVLTAYLGTFSVGLVYQSTGITILSMCLFELGTPAYLWIVAFLEPINSHVYGPQMVWNSTAIAIVATQLLVAVGMPLIAWNIQSRKRDFI